MKHGLDRAELQSGMINMVMAYLERHGWHDYEWTNDPWPAVYTGWTEPSGRNVHLIIRPVHDSQTLVLYVPRVVSALPDETPADCLNGLLMMIAYMNSEELVGRWGYDPDSGDVSYAIGVPLVDLVLSFEQFDRCLGQVQFAPFQFRDTLQSIILGEKAADLAIREHRARWGSTPGSLWGDPKIARSRKGRNKR